MRAIDIQALSIQQSAFSRTRCSRRGLALYLTTVCVSILVGTLGLTMLATQRGDRRLQSNVDLENQAWWIARAGIEIGLSYFEQVPTWRQQLSGNTILSNAIIGNGTCTVQVFDDRDNSLSNSETDPARLVATATCNGSTYKLQASLLPRPHPALAYCCFGSASNTMQFRSNVTIKGPVRSHGDITRSSNPAVLDDAYFETMTGYSIDDQLTPKRFVSTAITAPSVNVAWYLSQATAITGTNGSTCQLKGYNLTSTSNPTGSANANGIYSLDPGGRNVVIQNMHVKGTLIITNASGLTVTFQKGLWVEPGATNYPVLLIDNAGGTTSLSPSFSTLTEVSSGLVLVVAGIPITVGTGVDFNEDGDIADVFPTSVRGIVWTSANSLTMNAATWSFMGTAINRQITVDDSVTVDNDVQLQNSLAPNFLGTGMRLISTNFRDAP